MPITGDKKRAYQKGYMRGYMRNLRGKGLNKDTSGLNKTDEVLTEEKLGKCIHGLYYCTRCQGG